MAWNKRVVVWCVVLTSGCTGGMLPGSSSSSSSSGAAEPAVVQGYRTFMDALCGYYERCKDTLGPRYSDVTACQRVVEAELLTNRRTYEAKGLGYDIDAAAMTACTTALTQSACADRVPAAVLTCQNALAPKVPHMAGGTCSALDTAGTPRCALPGDNWCNADSSGCGVCAVRKDNMASCSADDQCKTGFCNPLGSKCADLPSGKAVGEGCLFTIECKGNLVCAGGVLQKTCSKRALPGTECDNAQDGNKPKCVEDLACVAGAGGAICALPLTAGQTCPRESYGVGCADYCTFAAADAATGTCAALTTLPGDGQPCALHNVGGYNVPTCASGLNVDLFPDETLTGTPAQSVACTCRTRGAAGASCKKADACASHVCTGASGTTAGTCTSLAANGAPCANNADCQSAYCGGTGQRTCQVLPVCQ